MVEKEAGPLSIKAGKIPMIRKRKADDVSESLSDIDDTEVTGYLNSRSEILFKKLVWEAMNEDYLKGTKGKQGTQKKSTSLKKTVASQAKKENKKTKTVEGQWRNSKINYDALAKLTDELAAVTESSREALTDLNVGSHPDTQQPNEESSRAENSFGEGEYSSECERQSGYNEEVDANMYYGNEYEEDHEYEDY